MDHWAAMFLNALEKAGITVKAFMKYVDDINIVTEYVPLGSRWDGDQLTQTEETLLEDRMSGVSREALTMRIVLELANRIIPWLFFTSDLPEDHDNKKIPMLDLQVWLQHDPQGEEPDTLYCSFYDKSNSSS